MRSSLGSKRGVVNVAFRQFLQKNNAIRGLCTCRPSSFFLQKTAVFSQRTYATEVYHNMLTPVRFLERTASTFPNRTAVVYGNQRYTYNQMLTRVNQLANSLKSLGVGYGDKVGFLCPNTPPMLEAHYAVPLIGATLVPVNTRLVAKELTYICNHADVKVLFVDWELSSAVHLPDLPHITAVINIEDPAFPGKSVQPSPTVRSFEYEQFLALSAETPVPRTLTVEIQNEIDLISLNYTSGTTGNPKGVMLHHRGAYLNALGQLLHTGINGKSSYLWTLPMFHCNGWCYTWAVTAIGAKHVCLRKVEFPEIFRLLQSEGISHMCAAPVVVSGTSMYANALQRKDASSAALTPLKGLKVITAGAPPGPKVIEDLESFGVNVTHVYGMTEVYGPHTICDWKGEEWDQLDIKEKAIRKSRRGMGPAGYKRKSNT